MATVECFDCEMKLDPLAEAIEKCDICQDWVCGECETDHTENHNEEAQERQDELEGEIGIC